MMPLDGRAPAGLHSTIPALPVRDVAAAVIEAADVDALSLRDALKPASDGLGDRLDVRPEAVVALHAHDLAVRGGRRDAERITRALDDQSRDRHLIEFGETAHRCRSRRDSARGLQREGEAEHSDRARRLGGAAGHPRARGATADDEWQTTEEAGDEVVDHRDPSGIQLARRRG